MTVLSPDRVEVTSSFPIRSGDGGRVSLRTLVSLRWLAIIGQLTAVLVVSQGLELPIPLWWCLGVILLSAAVNVGLMAITPMTRQVGHLEATAQIAFDTIQLTLLLLLTGGIENPFSLLLIAAASAAASTLRWKAAVAVVALALVCLLVLVLWALPLPWNPPGGLQLPKLYQTGMAAAIAIGILFLAASSWRLADGESRLGDALLATQAVLAREQRMAALGGLAAAAAHELGTPLATIQVTAKELSRSLPEGHDREDAELILGQAERCRVILRNLTSGRSGRDRQFDTLPFGLLLEEATRRHAGATSKAVLFDIAGAADGSELTVRRSPEILHGIGNLVENALGFAATSVTIHAQWDDRKAVVEIVDDGPGFDPDILPRLGEPYVTTRGVDSRGREADGHEGLGLGFFIAKTLLERSGGRVTFRNRYTPKRGAIVRVEWSRQRLGVQPAGVW